MIPAKELRIGNWVNEIFMPYGFSQGSQYVKIEAVRILDIEYKKTMSFNYEPISLSPLILSKSGFIWQGGDHYANEKNDIWLEDKAGLYRFARPCLTRYNLKHLHHLQNLYFDLFDKEIEINLL